jgi:hypothetical protein
MGSARPLDLLVRLREDRSPGVEGLDVLEPILIDCLGRRRPFETGMGE